MEPYEVFKTQHFENDVDDLELLARNNINILRVTPHPVCDEWMSDAVTVDFEYQYRPIHGPTKWHKGSVTVNNSATALRYVYEVAAELQKRLEQDKEC